jgi:tetratricopeptide (TPR) repeat protein/transglutaminase-like putative cysteine protease
MLRFWRRFTVFVSCILAAASIHAQTPSKAEVKPDYSKEALIFENSITRIVFENDGTGTRDSSARIRIQSDAGVQRYALLTFAYQNSIESLDIDYVRVVKPDASIVVTPPENTQDITAEITRGAPFYSDLREKHVAVKGLSVGDRLEFKSHWTVTKPLAPGQFWYAYNFTHNDIILHEQLQISVPRERAMKWKSRDLQPVIAEEGTRRVFTWTSSELAHKSTGQEKTDQETTMYQAARGKLPPADVHLSTFQSWEEVGRWYGSLQQERVKPSPEVRTRAAELTKGAGDDNAKLLAIYKYVSTQFHYIGIAFGIGRYQPHPAAEVLSNQYGDCKDKHTLFASLLDAAGIKAYPALISSAHELDLDVPSPGQFDHVIGVVPQASGFLWFDTTTEVAPFAYLVKPLRDKQALVIQDNKPPSLVATPLDPPSKLSQTFTLNGKLDDTGTLTGKIDRTVRGDDTELLFRSAFRRTPMPQWKDLIQQISYGSGFAGDVSVVTVSSPEKTDEPFRLAYSYTRKDYPDWSGRQISSPLPPFLGQTLEKPANPIILGELGTMQYESHVELPKGYSPELPANLDLKEDFADYYASYTVKDGVLITERHFVVKLREVPLSKYDAYKKFAKAVSDDHERYIAISLVTSSGTSSATTRSYQDEIWELPYSKNPEAARAYDQAREAFQKHDPKAEVASLQHAVAIDPKFTRAWLWLGEIFKFMRRPETAANAYRRAIDVDQQPVSYKALGFVLMDMNKFEDALPVWQSLLKIQPASVDGLSALGRTFFNLKRYAEASAAIERAITLAPDRPALYVQLGSAYLLAGNSDKSTAAFKKALEIDPRPLWFNDVAYALADANKQLPQALDYAERAVREEEEASAKVLLSDLKKDDLGYTRSLAAYWDTLGWVRFRMGNYEKAEKYLNAAWVLSEGAVEADHLGQLYEQQDKKQAAIHLYQLALASTEKPGATNSLPETRARLEHLSPGASASASLSTAAAELTTIRTFKLDGLAAESVSAEYFLLFAAGSKIEDVKFISGDDTLQSALKVIPSIPFNVAFPDDGPTRLLRRAIIACSPVSGCKLVLFTPDSVRSVN